MLIAGASMITFGQFSSFPVFFLFLFINGAAQSQCWPNSSKILGAWFSDDVRNSVFGVFGTCAFMGGVLGTSFAVYLQSMNGWRSVFFLPSIIVIAMGFTILLLFNHPTEVGVESPRKETVVDNSTPSKMPSWWELFKTMMIPEIAMGVLCLKTVRYCLIMWLPMYLLQQLHYSKTEAGMFSTAFEIGGVAGSASLGIIIDKCFTGRPLAGSYVFMLLSTISLVLFISTSQFGMAANTIFMFLAGAFNCGPDTILGASVPASIGDSNGRNAGAAMVGLVNGVGSIGMFVEGPIIGIISSYFGWSGMFYLMIVVSLLGTFCIYRSSRLHDRQKASTAIEI